MKLNALNDVVVVDLSQNLPGPYCSLLLQRQGAKVIKVESHKKPDPATFLPGLYQKLNAGKHIISLDVTSEAGRAELIDWVAKADVVIEGSRPGVAAKLNIDFDSLKRFSDKLIYCSISGYGQQSEKRLVPAHDINLQAESGLCSMSGKRHDAVCAIPIADMTSSYLAYSEILSALVVRQQRATAPQFLDIAMSAALNDMVSVWAQTKTSEAQTENILDKSKWSRAFKSINPIRLFLKRAISQEPLSRLPHYGIFKTKDGSNICIGIVDEQHFWRALCDELGGLLKHCKQASLKQRLLLAPFYKRLIARRLMSNTGEHWLHVLSQLPVSGVR